MGDQNTIGTSFDPCGKRQKIRFPQCRKRAVIGDDFDMRTVRNGSRKVNEFTFQLWTANEQFAPVGTEALRTAKNTAAADGVSSAFSFNSISYDTAGDYYYVVKEANDAFNALTAEDKALVPNADKLIAKIEELNTVMGKTVDLSKTYAENFPAPPAPPAGGEDETKPTDPTQPTTPDGGGNDSNSTVLIVVIAVVAVAAVAAVVIVVMKKKKPETEK